MVCLLKDNENKKNLEDLTKIVGDEDAAYYLLCANNGFTLDKTPTGEDSMLYAVLIAMHNGDKEKAILAKTAAYLPEMGDWQDHPESSTLTLDKLGEPSIKHIQQTSTDEYGGISVNDLYDAEDVTKILADDGKLNQRLNILRDNNILDRAGAIQQAIKEGRDSFIYKYIEEISKYEDITPIVKYLRSQDARRVWDERKQEEIIEQILKRLADAFHLKKVTKGFYTYFEGDENDATGKLRIKIVNNISKYIKEAPEGTKGAYSEDINHLMSVLYISLLNGDHTTIVHELVHRYIRNFWDTQPVQDALKVVEKRNMHKNPLKVEEALVEKITNMLDTDAKLNASFWSKMNNMLSKLFSTYSNKREILDDITAYFSINKDLSDFTAETIYFEKIYKPVFMRSATENEKKLLDQIKSGVKTRIKAMMHEDVRNNAVIASLREMDATLEKLDSDNAEDLKTAINMVLAACEEELHQVAIVLGNAELNGIENLDIKQFNYLRYNTLGYYRHIIDNKISKLFDLKNSNPDFIPGSDLFRRCNSASADLFTHLKVFLNQTEKWVDWYIDKSADELVTFADKEIWKTNAKHWVRNEIEHGDISWFLRLFGAINSPSPIINLIDHLVRRKKNHIEPIVQERGHDLIDLFDSYTHHVDVLPVNQFRDFCEHSFKRDATGRRGLTGNFRRSENWGEMQALIDKKKRLLAKELGIEEFFDENLRLDWTKLTDELYNKYYDALDDFYELNDIIRQYKPDYYRTLRKYLSKETIEYRKELREQINLLETKCKNQKTGVVETFRLNPNDLLRYKDLKKQLLDLSNPLDIVQDDTGKIISIEEKDFDTKFGKMAKELILFRNAIRDKVLYVPDYEHYNEDLKKLRDSGAQTWQLKMWEEHNTMKKIASGVFSAGGPKTLELALLYAERLAIVNATKPAQGYYMPNLDNLNDEAWDLLRELDLSIADLEKEIIDAGGTLPSGGTDPEAVIRKMYVLHYNGSTVTSDSQLDVMHEQLVTRMLALNPNAEFDFLSKYYYTKYKKSEITGEWEQILTPLTAFYTLIANNPDYINENEPIGKYTVPVGSYVESQFNRNEPSFIQPKPNGKWHDEEFVKLYGNGLTRYAKLYDLFIQTMGEIYQNYGMVDTNKYQLPGIRDDGVRTFYRRGFWTKTNFKEMYGLNETDDLYNELTSLIVGADELRPDGTLIRTIPMRWIGKLKNPNLVCTDLIRTVTMMYEASLNYKEKSEILPIIETLTIPMGLGYFDAAGAKGSEQASFINAYVDQFVFDRKRKVEKYSKPWINKAADTIMHKTHSKLMAHKWKVVIKNAVDSFWNFMKEMSGGKYFTIVDTVVGGARIMGEMFQPQKRNIGVTNTRMLVSAIMQRNNLAGSTSELFKGLRSSAIRRFLAKHFNMGEYTLVDYLFRGLIAMAVYHNHRLVENPLTGNKEFMNKWQAAYVYSKAGLSEKDGMKEWSKAGIPFKGTTMLDAVYVDKKGNLRIKDEYKDIVRPNGSNLLETRIETIIHERAGVINGVLDEMDKPELFTTTLGAMVGQMRGWMVAQSADNYKMAHQFQILYEDLDKFGLDNTKLKQFEDEEFVGLANLSTGYMESGQNRGWLRAYGRCITALIHVNKLFNIENPTKLLKYQTRAITVSLMSIAVVIAMSVLFGKMVEDDEDNLINNFLYSVNTGVLSERTAQIPYGIVISMLELIRSITVTKSYYDDLGSISDVMVDAYQWWAYEHGYINTQPYLDIIKRGVYTGLEKWWRDLLKASSLIIPQYSWNGIYNNFSKGAYISTDNFYNNQFPVSIVNYLPQRGSNKSNVTTWLVGETGVEDMFESSANAVSEFINFENSPF